ncbi:General transcription factor IIE subunit 1 [Melia azedarach]|uniref:General transcription factor IIE subunit 1 n=1 Tax=Melia azedarach TaxID=155640 RepID=A0ACC1X354_MELAZ|nr:General transcription factor IIE subunit 1 [Melia azedarach]
MPNLKLQVGNLKVLPPWMIKQGMNLMEEQRGQIKQEQEKDGSSVAGGSTDNKKSTIEEDKNILLVLAMESALYLLDVKAYYAAFIEKQQELEKAAQKQDEAISDGLCGMSNNRQVGMNSKCEVGEEEASVVDKYVKHQLK